MTGAPQRLTWSPTETPRSRPIEASQADHQRSGDHLSLLIAEERRQSYLRRRAATSNAAAGIADDAGIGYRDDGDGVDITGCTLSRDGSKLYVATETGIVEYHVDIAGRKVFPSYAPR
ncbi:hypothetical protein HOY82DRAFT_581426 [Tuber indicum]|nr:hypothetical protein HOY82DRAFT_581426 [Tuber indicum]